MRHGGRVGLAAGLLHHLEQALAGQLAGPAFLLTDSAMLVVLSVVMALLGTGLQETGPPRCIAI